MIVVYAVFELTLILNARYFRFKCSDTKTFTNIKISINKCNYVKHSLVKKSLYLIFK
ncbi:hypothetical protein CPIN18020_0255 [Campylobacter pinnipediorum subsp. caledonicus]|nr:hypothetical protein CPIN18020_0255 [Campylobacter pinnipediorum subsp. caledonicus]